MTLCCSADAYPTISAQPSFSYFTYDTTYNNETYTDFYFTCSVTTSSPSSSTAGRGDAQFNVQLIASSGSSITPTVSVILQQTVTASELNVRFDAADLGVSYGKTVSR